MKPIKFNGILFIVLGGLATLSLLWGNISPLDSLDIYFSGTETAWVLFKMRLLRTLAALLCGAILAYCGYLIQAYFQNPLAGPGVLGMNSAASLGAVIYFLSPLGALFPGGQIGLSIIFVFLLTSLYLFLFQRGIRNSMLLLMGLLLSFVLSALMSYFQLFTDRVSLQKYIFWNMGGFENLTEVMMFVLFFVLLVLIGTSFFIEKNLEKRFTGQNGHSSPGLLILLSVSIGSGTVTSLAGPLAFIGLIVPQLTLLIFNSLRLKVLRLPLLLMGGGLCLLAEIMTRVPGTSLLLPLNANLTLLSLPALIYLLRQIFRSSEGMTW